MNDIIELPHFSVSLSVYKNDNPEHFKESVNSVINQTVKPSEVVLVVDGPIPEKTNDVIIEFENVFPNFKVIRLAENKGHAIARQTGMIATSYEMVALMDSDDIAVHDRFEKQLKYFHENPQLDVLGGQIIEFIDTKENVAGVRSLPIEDDEIKKYLKSRCPFNQMTVMMKKSSMLNAGGYIHWHYEEDYYLWIRMFEKGCHFSNLPDNLVYVRVGSDMYKRRGGLKYFKSEEKLQRYMWSNGIIGFPHYFFNISIRLVVQVFLPNKVRGWVFQKFFREKTIKNG